MTGNDQPPAPVPMFSGQPMHEYFCRMAELGPSVTMPASSRPFHWPAGEPFELPASYHFGGDERSVEDFLAQTDTAALLVVQQGRVRHEQYWLTGGPDVPWLSMSVAKSFISALVGVALADGSIRSLEDAMGDYIAVAAGSAYDGVKIVDVLQMSSGARWNEDYSDPTSDIFRLSAALYGVGTFDEFVATAVGENPPGTLCRYNSTDTQALTSLLTAATGCSLHDYMTEKLLEPLGMVDSSHWLVDAAGQAAGAFGLNMTARDFAKLGELYRNAGRWGDRQLVPADYVAASISAGPSHTRLGQVWLSDHHIDLGYGYQWWLPSVDPGEFSAIGVYNQLVYVHPGTGAVIVKLSANRAYGTSSDERTNRDVENTAFLRGIARHLGSS